MSTDIDVLPTHSHLFTWEMLLNAWTMFLPSDRQDVLDSVVCYRVDHGQSYPLGMEDILNYNELYVFDLANDLTIRQRLSILVNSDLASGSAPMSKEYLVESYSKDYEHTTLTKEELLNFLLSWHTAGEHNYHISHSGWSDKSEKFVFISLISAIASLCDGYIDDRYGLVPVLGPGLWKPSVYSASF